MERTINEAKVREIARLILKYVKTDDTHYRRVLLRKPFSWILWIDREWALGWKVMTKITPPQHRIGILKLGFISLSISL